jgi:hypothetical protein
MRQFETFGTIIRIDQGDNPSLEVAAIPSSR